VEKFNADKFTFADMPELIQAVNKLIDGQATIKEAMKRLLKERFSYQDTLQYLESVHGLKYTISTLRNYVCNGFIPHHRAGSTVYFKAQDLDAWTECGSKSDRLKFMDKWRQDQDITLASNAGLYKT